MRSVSFKISWNAYPWYNRSSRAWHLLDIVLPQPRHSDHLRIVRFLSGWSTKTSKNYLIYAFEEVKLTNPKIPLAPQERPTPITRVNSRPAKLRQPCRTTESCPLLQKITSLQLRIQQPTSLLRHEHASSIRAYILLELEDWDWCEGVSARCRKDERLCWPWFRWGCIWGEGEYRFGFWCFSWVVLFVFLFCWKAIECLDYAMVLSKSI